MLLSRVRTTGIEMVTLPYKNVAFQFYNVGGGQNERQEWIDSFDHVTAVIFIVSLSGYNHWIKNSVNEALSKFESSCNDPLFEAAHMFLFLNKLVPNCRHTGACHAHRTFSSPSSRASRSRTTLQSTTGPRTWRTCSSGSSTFGCSFAGCAERLADV